MTNTPIKSKKTIVDIQNKQPSKTMQECDLSLTNDLQPDPAHCKPKPDNGEIKRHVGIRLKESRRAARFTQTQVACCLHMTQQQYSRFENGIFELNYWQLSVLCGLFDISADFLLGLTEY